MDQFEKNQRVWKLLFSLSLILQYIFLFCFRRTREYGSLSQHTQRKSICQINCFRRTREYGSIFLPRSHHTSQTSVFEKNQRVWKQLRLSYSKVSDYNYCFRRTREYGSQVFLQELKVLYQEVSLRRTREYGRLYSTKFHTIL